MRRGIPLGSLEERVASLSREEVGASLGRIEVAVDVFRGFLSDKSPSKR
jgi:hypothetical protein